jgi:hypothetical protein
MSIPDPYEPGGPAFMAARAAEAAAFDARQRRNLLLLLGDGPVPSGYAIHVAPTIDPVGRDD